jgi:hypothetical protein
MRATCRAHLTLITLGEEYRLWSSSLRNILHDPSSSLLGPNILLNTVFSKTLRLCSSLKVRHKVSYPYSTTGKITVLYILIFIFLYETGRHSGSVLSSDDETWSYTWSSNNKQQRISCRI